MYKNPTIYSKPIARLEVGRLVIIKKCKERYEDAYVYVELIKTRTFKVLITGDFMHSGMFPVSSVDRVSDLIESMHNLQDKQNFLSITDSLIYKHLPDYPKNMKQQMLTILTKTFLV